MHFVSSGSFPSRNTQNRVLPFLRKSTALESPVFAQYSVEPLITTTIAQEPASTLPCGLCKNEVSTSRNACLRACRTLLRSPGAACKKCTRITFIKSETSKILAFVTTGGWIRCVLDPHPLRSFRQLSEVSNMFKACATEILEKANPTSNALRTAPGMFSFRKFETNLPDSTPPCPSKIPAKVLKSDRNTIMLARTRTSTRTRVHDVRVNRALGKTHRRYSRVPLPTNKAGVKQCACPAERDACLALSCTHRPGCPSALVGALSEQEQDCQHNKRPCDQAKDRPLLSE